MQSCLSYQVEKLSAEDSWALFKQRAFAHGGVLESETFVSLGRNMVERCGGLPLAVKIRGFIALKEVRGRMVADPKQLNLEIQRCIVFL